jgi:hypothetical protein
MVFYKGNFQRTQMEISNLTPDVRDFFFTERIEAILDINA